MQKKYLIILLVVVLLIIILIMPKPWMSKKQPGDNPANKTASSTEASKVTLPPLAPGTAIPSAQIPKALPANLPFEKGAQILQNFEVKDPVTGKTQSSRIYLSGKTIDDNYAIYQKYLKDNGWTIFSGLSQPVIKNLDATKGTARLDITISIDDKGKVTVSVSYLN